MAYVEGYNYDLFVSYSHNDNHDNWVTEFIHYFKSLLIESGLKNIEIYIDYNKLQRTGGDIKDNLQHAVINESAMFLRILSDSYFKSNYCKLENDLFMEKKNYENRMISIQKSKIDQYNFVLLSDKDHYINKFFGKDFTCWNFIKDTYKLAQDVINQLNELRKRTYVYFAKPFSDIAENRYIRTRQNLERYYSVLTSDDTVINASSKKIEKCNISQYREKVKDDIKNADLYIHMFTVGKLDERDQIQLKEAKENNLTCRLFIQGDAKLFVNNLPKDLKVDITECTSSKNTDIYNFIKEIKYDFQSDYEYIPRNSDCRVKHYIDFVDDKPGHLSRFLYSDDDSTYDNKE
jgi:hypothetical protein